MSRVLSSLPMVVSAPARARKVFGSAVLLLGLTLFAVVAEAGNLVIDIGQRYNVNVGGLTEFDSLAMTGGIFFIGNMYSDVRIGATTIEYGGLGNISQVGGTGNIRFLDSADLRGTLRLFGTSTTVHNDGVMALSGAGSLALFYTNLQNGGEIDIQNDAWIFDDAMEYPYSSITNLATGLIHKSGVDVAGASTILPKVYNFGSIRAEDGILRLAGGGEHYGLNGSTAHLAGSPNGELQLLGNHRIRGNVEASGFVRVGNPFPDENGQLSPASLTVASDGVLTNNGYLDQIGGLVVETNGQVSNAGNYYVHGPLHIMPGAGFSNDGGSLSLATSATALVNDGVITNNGGPIEVIAGSALTGSGSYWQYAGGSTYVEQGSSIDLGDQFVQYDGTTNVKGLIRSAAGIEFWGGELNGTGTLQAPTVYIDALVTGTFPGNSPGVLTIDGNLDAAGATFYFELAGPLAGSQYDQLVVTGDANLAGANIYIEFLDGFLPQVDDMFDLFHVDGLLDGLDSATFNVFSDAGNVSGYLDPGQGRFIVYAVTSAVPVPAALWLLASALGLLVARRRTGC